jgi:hypothetical protein
MRSEKRPPLGVRLTIDVEEYAGPRGTTFWARVRWTNPANHHREGVKRAFDSREAVEDWLETMRHTAKTGFDPGQTLSQYVELIGDRWTRAIDPTSTYDPYAAGLRRRVLPTLGHLPVTMISAGLVDRAIDAWEQEYGRSTSRTRWPCWCSCSTKRSATG